MDKLTIIIASKRMPFVFLGGDHPVYVLITLLKDENPNKYYDIVPVLGPPMYDDECYIQVLQGE